MESNLMRNIWSDAGGICSAPSGPDMITDVFRGFHPRLFMLFASSEHTARTGLSIPGEVTFTSQSARPTSAQRMNMNSRGCQPTEQRRKTISTLRGSNHERPLHVRRTNSRCHQDVRPLQGRGYLRICSVGCTHGYSCCSPSVNRTDAASHQTCRHSMFDLEC